MHGQAQSNMLLQLFRRWGHKKFAFHQLLFIALLDILLFLWQRNGRQKKKLAILEHLRLLIEKLTKSTSKYQNILLGHIKY